MTLSPQIRSRQVLTEQGYLVWTVEAWRRFPSSGPNQVCPGCGRWEKMTVVKTDLFNCFDLIGEHPQLQERVYVQATSLTNHATRRNKILSSFEAKLLLMAGARVLIHSWGKNQKLNRWALREEEITLRDFRQAFAYPNSVKELREIRRKARAPDLPLGTSLGF